MPVRVKICGVTNPEDARVSVESGADALGFIFFSASPRCISSEKAAAIISELPPFIAKVGVFVDAPVNELIQVANDIRLDTVQLHGSETPEQCDQVIASGLNVVKAFRVKDASTLDSLIEFRPGAFLLDSYVAGHLGGTGARFNWDLAVKAKQFGRPIILAGGLDPENVSDAVSKVRPYAVDVSSGVESFPGRKDHEKLRLFIMRAKKATH